ncbi:MAG: dephospho-CoA kinase [Verrucomicrobiales bacterium]
MKTIAITGGIATGKSTLVRRLIELFGDKRATLFDCDAEAHNLLTKQEIIATVVEEFGSDVLNPDGGVNRATLRQIVFEDEARRLTLEGMLHPQILNSANKALLQAASVDERPELFVLDVPLLYEVDFPIERDLDVVIAASKKTQSQRLSEYRNLDQATIESLLNSQLPISDKIENADVVIWNDGSSSELEFQTNLLSEMLKAENLLPS